MIGSQTFFYVMVTVACVSFVYWKKATLGVMIWILFAGAVRKWVLPELSDIVFLINHAMLAGIYARVLLERKKLSFSSSSLALILALVFWGIASSLNPAIPSMKVAAAGLVIHFFYIPLAFILPHIFPSKDALMSFLRRYALISVPILILGTVQFFRPINDPINSYVVETKEIATAGDHARVTSTFSYISGYTSYLSCLILLLVYLFTLPNQSRNFRIVIAALITLTTINLFMTGSRGPVGMSVISVSLYFMISSSLGFGFARALASRAAFALSLLVVVVTFTYIGRESYNAFYARAQSTEDIGPRVFYSVFPFHAVREGGLFGQGIGTTYQGTTRLNTEGALVAEYEGESQRIIVELGLFGYFLVYGLRLLLLIQSLKLFKSLQDVDLKLLALCSFLFQLQFFQIGNLVFNLTSGILYWFFVGFLFLLPQLDGQRDEKETELMELFTEDQLDLLFNPQRQALVRSRSFRRR